MLLCGGEAFFLNEKWEGEIVEESGVGLKEIVSGDFFSFQMARMAKYWRKMLPGSYLTFQNKIYLAGNIERLLPHTHA